MITAQTLYNRREDLAEISGTELHALFEAVCGDSAPRGNTLINPGALRAYAQRMVDIYNEHANATGVGGRGQHLLDIANFCDSTCNEAPG